MVLYKVIENITLSSMGREKDFKKDEEVTESLWTKFFPKYFKRIGEYKREMVPLAEMTFIPDPIDEFVQKENQRKEENIKEILEMEEVKEFLEAPLSDEIKEDIKDFVEDELTKSKEDKENKETEKPKRQRKTSKRTKNSKQPKIQKEVDFDDLLKEDKEDINEQDVIIETEEVGE